MTEHKSIQGRGADLVSHFAQRSPPIFDAREATGFLGADPTATAAVLSTLVARGWLVRHRKGTYEIAPLWATSDTPFDPDRFAAVAHWVREPYYVGFRSALEIRDWLDHPVRGRIWIAVPQPRHAPTTVRDRVTWVVLLKDRFSWGRQRHWIGDQAIWMSDAERTILDCLHLPRHAGGISEVAAVLVRAWSSLEATRLAEYTDRLGIDAVRRRLGYLLDHIDLPHTSDVSDRLQRSRSNQGRTAVLLDPSLPPGGLIDRRWNVRVNLDPLELALAGQT